MKDVNLEAALREIVGPAALLNDAASLESYGQDWTRFQKPAPSLVLLPKNSLEVSKIVNLAAQHQVPLVPSGGRTGLAGAAVAAQGEWVLNLSRMNAMSPVDIASQSVRVEAGVVTQALHEHCAKVGLSWPIDLAAKGSSQIGGNIATNAGGVRVIRYGHVRHWVQSLEVVFADGSICELNGNLEKNNTGFDLRQLVIGSEGTLGIVTAATLKLTPLIEHTELLFFGVSSMSKVLELLKSYRQSAFRAVAFEFLTKACMQAVCKAQSKEAPFTEDCFGYVLIELERPSKPEDLESWLEQLMSHNTVVAGTLAQSPSMAKLLWSYREGITESLASRGLVYKNDLALPIARLDEFCASLMHEAPKWYGSCELFVFGHIGDGNLHVNVVNPKNSALGAAEFLKLCEERNHDLFNLVKRCGGSIAAEHGIGTLKKKYLHYTRSEKEIELFKGIKRAFDPLGILNPGKIIDL